MLKGIGRFGRKLKVDRFLLHYVAAGYDPYNTAMTFGYVNAALNTLAPICAERFTVKDCSVWTAVDFTDDWPHVDFAIAMSFRLCTVIGMLFVIGFGALKVLLRRKKRIKQEKQAAGSVPPDAENKDNEQTIQDEERMAANG